MSVFVYKRTPSFADTDAAGLVHFSRLACYVEEAEHAFLAQAGSPIDLQGADALYWPRVTFSAEYTGPVMFGQPLEIRLGPVCSGRCSVEWTWEVVTEQGTAARGTMTTLCCRRSGTAPSSRLEAVALPDPLREAVQGAGGA